MKAKSNGQGELFARSKVQAPPPAPVAAETAYCVALRQGYLGHFIAVSPQRWSDPQEAMTWRKAEQPRWMGRLEVVPASVLEK